MTIKFSVGKCLQKLILKVVFKFTIVIYVEFTFVTSKIVYYCNKLYFCSKIFLWQFYLQL